MGNIALTIIKSIGYAKCKELIIKALRWYVDKTTNTLDNAAVDIIEQILNSKIVK